MASEPAPIPVRINGEESSISEPMLLAVLAKLKIQPDASGVAVAINGEVVRRADWEQTQLRAGDRIEVLGAMQGG